MPGDLRRDLEQGIIRHHGDTGDTLLMITHKANVLNDRGETIPARHTLHREQQAREVSVAGEVSINVGRQSFEILDGQLLCGTNAQNSRVLVQMVVKHGTPPATARSFIPGQQF